MSANDDPIRCYPPRTPLWQWPLVILATVSVFGGIIFAALIMLSDLLNGYQTPPQTKFSLLAVSGALSLLLLVIFMRWDQDRWYWVLEKDALIGGKKKDKIFLLASLETIVPGLPEKTHVLVAASKLTHPALWQTILAERRLALLLKFSDGSFMPFHVHRCVHGRQLMLELIQRLADRLDGDYQYTPREVKALRGADWNRLVSRRAASS